MNTDDEIGRCPVCGSTDDDYERGWRDGYAEACRIGEAQAIEREARHDTTDT